MITVKKLIFLSLIIFTLTVNATGIEKITVKIAKSGDIDKDAVIELIKEKALFDFVKSIWKSKDIPSDVLARYVSMYRPIGYIKDVKLIKYKVVNGVTYATGVVFISTGKVITGLNELVEDLGNPRVFVEVRSDSDEISDVVYTDVIRNISKKGFTVVDKITESDITLKVSVDVDKRKISDEYGERFVVSMNLSGKFIDSKSSEIFSSSNVSDVINGPNVSFMVSTLSDTLSAALIDKMYPSVMKFLWSRYNKIYELKLIGFDSEEAEELIDFLKDNLALILKIDYRGVKHEKGEKFRLIELRYIGKPLRLEKVLEKKYSISLYGSTLKVRKKSVVLVFKNCNSRDIKFIVDKIRELVKGIEVKSFKSNILTLSVQTDDAFELFLKLPEIINVEIIEMDENRCVYSLLRGDNS